ncbi:hypothetical protein DID88_002940 [Monilinia fructigena]|uniref:Sodium/calcium exchanger membrane region domain-containing protein n=1 Tax=Monilinia fructigena TaxID=38457 RepID=A0A395INK7_9HELO|nr:hypothetical protein DID88_002940 [Monilinia fructigena]
MARTAHRRKDNTTSSSTAPKDDIEMATTPQAQGHIAEVSVETTGASTTAHHNLSEMLHHMLPTHRVNHKGYKVTKGIQPDGESGRRGIHPFHFFRICWASTSDASRLVNILWPVVPAALAVKYTRPEKHLVIFILNYIAMVPCANLIGFAGQELARKLPKVFGILLETTLGSIVEMILFIVLLTRNEYSVIQAAILGSMLATLLLCLGMCFFVGGLTREEQEFDEAVSEVGSGLLLTAGMGLIVPSAFETALELKNSEALSAEVIAEKVLNISRVTAVLLIIAYGTYVFFQMRTHHGIYDAILEADEQKDEDRHEDLQKDKLTFTECIVALSISIALVTLIAISLVEQIPHIVEERGISDAFMGLILVPLEQTIQTALFNGPLVVIISWGLGKKLDLNFEMFDIVVLILAILVVGNFLRDQKSNYLEGALCVIVYIIIAVAAFFYPNPEETHVAGEATDAAVEVLRALL